MALKKCEKLCLIIAKDYISLHCKCIKQIKNNKLWHFLFMTDQ